MSKETDSHSSDAPSRKSQPVTEIRPESSLPPGDSQVRLTRRDFVQALAAGTVLASASAVTACGESSSSAGPIRGADASANAPTGQMTYRTNPNTGDRVSLLGFGCMRLPTVNHESARSSDSPIDQDEVNRQVDYALAHGVNYFDTSPAYCKGRSPEVMGKALSRHPRSSYFIATKLSNFAKETWSREASMAIYEKSFQDLKVDVIDYMLLHGVGMGSGMEEFNARYIDNGMLDFLLEERAKGRIRNLGFSYHGDIQVFDHLLQRQDRGELRWDFVQIQLNYMDWKHAKEVNQRNTNAEYLYGELHKRGIPAIIMEPLLGGRLASLSFSAIQMLKQLSARDTIASWAFRFAGSPEGVLTVLSGMTYMEDLEENVRTFSPLSPLSGQELTALEEVAVTSLKFPTVPCNTCQYCMPCPFGLDIPSIFSHYNRCLTEGKYAKDIRDEGYGEARKAFLIGYDRTVPKLRQADRCVNCGKCAPHCPQRIDIPGELRKIDEFVESMKQGR